MQNYNSRDSGGSDVLLFLAGAGLGIGLGILLAPKSGQETRQAIRGRVNDGKDYLTRQSRDLANKASTLADKASGLADKGRETLEKHKSSVSAALDAGRQAYRETVSATV